MLDKSGSQKAKGALDKDGKQAFNDVSDSQRKSNF